MAIKEYPIIGFAPDAPADTPGIITSSSAVLPTTSGIGNGVSVTTTGAATTGTSLGVARLIGMDGTTAREFIGTPTKLYELVSSTATDLSATTYGATTTDTWQFAQYGTISLAVNKQTTLQASAATNTAFAAVAGAPKASVLITPGLPNGQFAMLFDYNDGTNNYTDGIFWSALADYTNWTPSIATECGNVRITDINGPWTAAIPFRDGVIAWKQHSMYLGAYVGGSDVWDFTRLSSDVGCLGKNACVVANDRIYFADDHGIWIYDGSFPQPMPGALQKWWTGIVATNALNTKPQSNLVRLSYDRGTKTLWLGYVLSGAYAANYVVYNTQSNLWTQYGNLQTAAAANAITELVDYNMGSTATGTTAKFASVDTTAANVPAGDIYCGVLGNVYQITMVRSIRPQFQSGPSDTQTGWLTGTLYYGPSLRNVTGANTAMTFAVPGRLDGMQSARFVQPYLGFTAGYTWEMTAIYVDSQPAGAE